MKYLLHIAYKGTRYRGWQRQADVISVQQTIEEAIIKIIGERIHIVGCGRTDAGVHASNYVAHFVVQQPLRTDFLFIINKILPHDIVMHSCEEVGRNIQAQMHVQTRRYDYYFHSVSDPMINEASTLVELEGSFDIGSMKQALESLLGTHDFRGFCKQADKHDHTVCVITTAELYTYNDRYQVRLCANRFLRSMVRLIVGNLVRVGKGEESLDKWNSVLNLASSFDDFNIAFQQGLHLSGVYYPSRVFDRESYLAIS